MTFSKVKRLFFKAFFKSQPDLKMCNKGQFILFLVREIVKGSKAANINSLFCKLVTYMLIK